MLCFNFTTIASSYKFCNLGDNIHQFISFNTQKVKLLAVCGDVDCCGFANAAFKSGIQYGVRYASSNAVTSHNEGFCVFFSVAAMSIMVLFELVYSIKTLQCKHFIIIVVGHQYEDISVMRQYLTLGPLRWVTPLPPPYDFWPLFSNDWW